MADTPELPAQSQKSIRETVVVALVLVVALVGGAVWMRSAARRPDALSRTRQVYAQYIGEPACRECHPGVTAQHSRSGHSKTLRPASSQPIAKLLDGKTGLDPEHPDATFHYGLSEGRFATTRKAADGSAEDLMIQYVFGSGQHAMTFVTLNDGHSAKAGGVEHRLTYFTRGESGELGITPGQDEKSTVERIVKTPKGRALSAEQTLKCFECHTTVLSDRGPSELDIATMKPNISCERCHGPGRSHVEAARRGDADLRMPFGEGRESADDEMRMCGYCHRLPEMGSPGAIREDNAELARFQPVGLMQSACYKKSNRALRCTTCHDPHTRTSTDLVAYEAQCLSCHRPQAESVCSVSPKTGCVGCHMPKVDAGQGIHFSDHWIRIRRGTAEKGEEH